MTDSLEKTLMLGKIESKKGSRWQRMRQLVSPTQLNLSKLQEIVKDKEVWHVAVHGATESDMT